MRILIPLTVALLAAAPLAAARPDPQAKLARLLGGRVAGAPQHCITLRRTTQSTTIDGIGIVYRDGATYYLNRFDQGCPGLDWNSYIVTRTPTTQLCRGDIALVQSNSVPQLTRGSCAFGPFVPYRKVKAR